MPSCRSGMTREPLRPHLDGDANPAFQSPSRRSPGAAWATSVLAETACRQAFSARTGPGGQGLRQWLQGAAEEPGWQVPEPFLLV